MEFGEKRYRDPKQAQQYLESSRWAFGYPHIIIDASLSELQDIKDVEVFFRQVLMKNLENYTGHQRFLLERALAGTGYMFRCFLRKEPKINNFDIPLNPDIPESTLAHAIGYISEIGYEMDPTTTEANIFNRRKFYASPEVPLEMYFSPQFGEELTIVCMYENITRFRSPQNDYEVRKWQDTPEKLRSAKPPFPFKLNSLEEYWNLPTIRDILKCVFIIRWQKD